MWVMMILTAGGMEGNSLHIFWYNFYLEKKNLNAYRQNLYRQNVYVHNVYRKNFYGQNVKKPNKSIIKLNKTSTDKI